MRRKVLVASELVGDQLKSGSMSILDVAALAKRLGLDGIEYRNIYWRNKQEEIPAVRAQLRELGLVAAYATWNPLQNEDEEGRQRVLTDLEDAAALGAVLMRIFRGPKPAPDKEGPVYEAAREALRKAASLGLTIALENHANELGCKLADVQDGIERYSSLGLRVNIDTGNYLRNGEDLMGAVRLFNPLIAYSHLKDVKPSEKGLSVTYLGDGTLDFAALFAEYDRSGHDFPVCFEFRGGDDLEGRVTKSLAVLRSLGVQ